MHKTYDSTGVLLGIEYVYYMAAVGLVFAGVFSGGWVGVFGCWSPLMNNPRALHSDVLDGWYRT